MPPITDRRKLFLSTVSSEFEPHRVLLAGDLKRPELDVAVQEDFITTDGSTLEKLDDYIRSCDGMVHLIGKATGAVPPIPAVTSLLKRYPDFAQKVPVLAAQLAQPDPGYSYTMWEAYLALYHERPLYIYRSADFGCPLDLVKCPRSPRFVYDRGEELAQEQHYRRLCDLGKDRGQFANEERLSSAVLRDLVHILPALERSVRRIGKHLPGAAEVLIGRDDELTMLDHAWADPQKNIVVVRGKGGEGKTSLVSTWMAELALKGWRGAEMILGWSFYSQGTRSQTSATAELFIHDMLEQLGEHAANTGSFEERAAHLARSIGDKRCLLVLDGLEPLQHPPGPLHGTLKDPGMAALLRLLAAHNAGLCVITTREKVDEIKEHYGRCAIDHDLVKLSPLAGAALLHRSGAQRAGASEIAADDQELQTASEEVQGHALTLFLVGQYLRLTQKGDIRRRDRMKLAEADQEYQTDATRPYGHAFKAMEAYEVWFASGDAQAQRQLAILRLLGLFDRPASADCLRALRSEPAIPHLTEPLISLRASEWSIALQRLADIDLLEVIESPSGEDNAEMLDCHPLIREYFAVQLKTKHPEAFRTAHARLFDHLCEVTPHRPDGVLGLQPLYQAVAHGCLAGRQQAACDKVYFDRILRGSGNDGFYSTKKLGAIGADLGAVAAFFEEPWSRLSPNLSAPDQAWLLSEAATRLRALGRLSEAVEPMRVSGEMDVETEEWQGAAISYSNLSELEVTLGRLDEAVADGRRAIAFADHTGDALHKLAGRTAVADALHQAGERAEASALFAEAERMQAERQPQFPLLYSLAGFRYAELLLAPAERAAWLAVAGVCDPGGGGLRQPRLASSPTGSTTRDAETERIRSGVTDPGYRAACAEAERRAAQALKIARDHDLSLLAIALDHLTLARAQLYRALLTSDQSEIRNLRSEIQSALAKLREANQLHYLPLALLTAALHAGALGQAEAAQRYLDEAQHIAQRGSMPLYLADVHLHRARLLGRDPATRATARDELTQARELIEKHGYGRRKEELADAEAWLGTGV